MAATIDVGKRHSEVSLVKFNQNIDELVRMIHAKPMKFDELSDFAESVAGLKASLKAEAEHLGLDFCFEITKGQRRYAEQREKIADEKLNHH